MIRELLLERCPDEAFKIKVKGIVYTAALGFHDDGPLRTFFLRGQSRPRTLWTRRERQTPYVDKRTARMPLESPKMKKTEETARELCRLDLLRCGVPANETPALAERFWPVLTNEIRQGIVVGEWPFSVDEIARLNEEYQLLLARWLPNKPGDAAEPSSAIPLAKGLGALLGGRR